MAVTDLPMNKKLTYVKEGTIKKLTLNIYRERIDFGSVDVLQVC